MDKRIGAQYYTIRKQITNMEEFDIACKKVADIGYKIVQISGVSLDAKGMREILDKYDLKCVTTHRKFDDFLNNLDEVIEYNKILGSDLCGVGIIPVSFAESNEKVTEYINEANKICETLKSENMYYGFHNHSLEFTKYDGKTIHDRLLEETDPETFRFIGDTYWYQLGGQRPADMIRRVGSRMHVIHFKDLRCTAQDWKTPLMGEVGNGNLDWDDIITACEEAGVKWAIVEQDRHHIDDDPFKALKMSYDFLKTKGFN